jgi:protein-ribulosamine 3-kinase
MGIRFSGLHHNLILKGKKMQDQLPANRILSDLYRIPLERFVSEYIGREWKVADVKDMKDYASHPAAILSDNLYSIFVKLSEAAHGLEQFEIELAGLRLLRELSGILTPTLIGNILVDGGVMMVLEAVTAIDRQPCHWRQIGHTLAQIHKIKGDWCGLETQGYFGPLYQDNRPMNDWASFYAERRLWPRLIGAIDSGYLSTALIRQMEKLISRLPELSGPEAVPSLLHGDAQQNNFISTKIGAIVIDPAVCYGNPEFDLAYIDYFQPVPEDVFTGYKEELQIDPGFRERRDLWRVYGYLAAVTAEGPVHLSKLINAVQKYL